MPTSIIAAVLVSTFTMTAATAGIIASGIVVAIGVGLSFLSSLLNKPRQPTPSDGQVIIRASAAPRFRSYGRVKVGGVLMFANSDSGFYYRVIAMGSGPIDAVEEHWIDDNRVTLSGNEVISAPYLVDGASRVGISLHLGNDVGYSYPALQTYFPGLWTPNHLGRGIPHALVVLSQVKQQNFNDVFPRAGDTQYRQVQRGALVPDVSGGVITAESWSDNGARVILDYMTHADALRLSRDWITAAAAEWETAIADCNVAIPLAAGGTEARWRIWNTYRLDERPADVLSRFLHACDAVVYPTPTRGLAIKVGKWTEPTVLIDDDAIVGFNGFGRGRDIITTANTIRAQFTDPEGDYQPTDAEIWTDAADVAERGEISTDYEFFSAPSHGQCRRLMKLASYRANPDWVGTLTCNLRALPAIGERFVEVTISELGIANAYFEISSTQFLIEEGSILRGIEIQLQSVDPAMYDWSTAEEGSPAIVLRTAPPIEPARGLPMPAGFTATANGPYAVLSWTPYASDFLTAEVRYRIGVPTNAWSSWPVAEDAHGARLGPFAVSEEVGAQYEFQIRTRSTSTARVSDWTASQYLTIGVDSWILAAEGVAAGVDMDFASDLYYRAAPTGATLTDLVAVSRAATGYAEDSTGQWFGFAANLARRTDKGLLVEGARTNQTRNNAAAGAVPGTPGTLPTTWVTTITGGLTREVVGTGTLNGIDYIDLRFFGTPGSGSGILIYPDGGTTTTAAVNGQTWSFSWFAALVGGSFTNIASCVPILQQLNSGGAFVANVNAPVVAFPTADLARQQVQIVTNNAATAFVRAYLSFNHNPSVAIDFTIRVGWPQLELGAFATSPIRTTTVAVARDADLVSLISPPTFGAAYTLYGQGTPIANPADQVYGSINDGTLNNAWSARRKAGLATARLVAGGSPADIADGAMAVGWPAKLAAAFDPASQGLALNGAAMSGPGALSAPTGVNAVSIGHGAAGSTPWDGYVERLALWPATRISNAGLQSLTEPTVSPPVWVLAADSLAAAVDLDFAINRYYRGGVNSLIAPITVSRAAVGYAEDTTGHWTSFAANIARRTDRGLLVEEARTNRIRNNSMQGAVPGTPGTLPTNWIQPPQNGTTRQIVAIGSVDGIDYIDIRVFGTVTTSTTLAIIAAEVNNLIAASVGQVWTNSMFVAGVGGAPTNISAVRLDTNEYNSTGTSLTAGSGSSFATALTSTLQRFSSVRTLASATVAFLQPRLTIVVTAIGAAIDVTFRVGWPQLELGGFVTSPIRTTSVAVARDADLVTLISPPTFGAAYTLYGQGIPSVEASDLIYGAISDGTVNNSWSVRRTLGVADARAAAGGSSIDITGAAMPVGSPAKLAAAYAASNQGMALNGTAAVAAASALVPAGLNTVSIGHGPGVNRWNGYVERLALWPATRISNAGLQSLTS